ncbi:HCL128Wp [Eremothecium sinecaudum]|uniref:Ribosome biogenesis protein RLP7 n=1 Tax=Eremothecium sinecaudum TaxID=45286 RepID=A0A109UYH1_9SACH|nr:HCL128Wp [Eremothecium sinecaudum]AMD20023.1 HCL128Wp [Eremothecium sinecaudum]
MVEELNSNPEVLLRKRRNADRTRVEKQELARKRKAAEQRQKRAAKNRFVRPESIVATTLATEREKERIKRVSKLARSKARDGNVTRGDYILDVRENPDAEYDDEDEGLVRTKIPYNGEEKLLFVVRVKGPTAVKIPQKAFKILTMLRLLELNTGIFLKLTAHSYILLKLISPYVVVGTPSPASIRALIQKRARILYQAPGEEQPKEIILNDNNIIEEKLGDEGIICLADIIHEIATLGDSFAKCSFFLLPIKLNREVSGFNAMSKLQKVKQRETQSKSRPLSNAATAPVIQVDIDALIEKLN